MGSIPRYIFRQLVAVTLFVTVTLSFAIWLAQSLRFVELIVNRGLSLSSFLHLTLLLVPSFLSFLLPIALITAVLFTYNKLASDSEIVVIQAIGLGPLQVAQPALWLAGAVVLAGYALSLYFLPLSYRAFKDLEFDARNDYSALLLREGAFNTLADGITVYLRSRETRGELHGLILHDNRIPARPVTMLAEHGTLTMTPEGPRVIMINGSRQEVERDSGRLSLLNFDRYSVDLGRIPQSRADRWREPRERYLDELFNPGNDVDRGLLARLHAEGHARLAGPLYALAFTLVGLAALLSGEFNRRGLARRIAVAATAVVLLQVASLGINSLIAKTPELTPLAYATVLGTIAVAGWWLVSPRRARSAGAAATTSPAATAG